MRKLWFVFVVWSIALIVTSIYPIYVMEESKPPNVALNQELSLYLSFQFPHADIILPDSQYILVDKPTIKEFLIYDDTNTKKYVRETFDCDDFAFTLWRNVRSSLGNVAFGVVSIVINDTSGHVLNLFVDTNWHIYFVEPQNDKIMNRHDIRFMRVRWVVM